MNQFTYFPIVLVFIEKLCEFDFKKSWRRPSDFENLRFILSMRSVLNAPLAVRLDNFCMLLFSWGKGNEVLIDVGYV